MAIMASSGMNHPPLIALASSISALLRAACVATGADEAEVAARAKTGVLAIDTPSIATKDAFLKLMSNSPLSWPLVHCHTDLLMTTPKFGAGSSPTGDGCAFAAGVVKTPQGRIGAI